MSSRKSKRNSNTIQRKKIEEIQSIFKIKYKETEKQNRELCDKVNTEMITIVRNQLLDKTNTLRKLEKVAKEGQNYIILSNRTSFYRHPLRKIKRNNQYEILYRLKDYYDGRKDSYVKKAYGPEFALEVHDEIGIFWSVFCRLVLTYNPN